MSRIIRGQSGDSRIPAEQDILILEASVVFYFDFSNDPKVAAGGVLSAPAASITNGGALVTLGAPAVTTATYSEYDGNGNISDTVPVGEGVEVAITPASTKGQITITCKATVTLDLVASTIARQVKVRVR